MNVLTILGTRPQYIKAAPLSRELQRRSHKESVLDTGQHYDAALSSDICADLGLSVPEVLDLEEREGLKHLGAMLPALEEKIAAGSYDWIITFGDTRSTLAAVLSALHTRVPIVHIEAGMRIGNTQLFEEYYRRIADHCSDVLFCPTQAAAENLSREGIREHVYLVGDLMYEQFLHTVHAESKDMPMKGMPGGEYCLLTIHRAENISSQDRLQKTLESVLSLNKEIVFPLHPHTRKKIEEYRLEFLLNNPLFHVTDPLPYSQLIQLINNASCVLTDSGGVQREAAFAGIACIVLRNNSEWMECVDSGIALILDDRYEDLSEMVKKLQSVKPQALAFGDGKTAEKIVSLLETISISKK